MRVDMELQQYGSVVVDMAAFSYAYYAILEQQKEQPVPSQRLHKGDIFLGRLPITTQRVYRFDKDN